MYIACTCSIVTWWGGPGGIEAWSLGPVHYFLQCFDTVGWVIWPVKPVPSGTLNPTQSQSISQWCCSEGRNHGLLSWTVIVGNMQTFSRIRRVSIRIRVSLRTGLRDLLLQCWTVTAWYVWLFVCVCLCVIILLLCHQLCFRLTALLIEYLLLFCGSDVTHLSHARSFPQKSGSGARQNEVIAMSASLHLWLDDRNRIEACATRPQSFCFGTHRGRQVVR